jgi:hypothetical protein
MFSHGNDADFDGLCYNPQLVCNKQTNVKGEILVFLLFKTLVLIVSIILTGAVFINAQENTNLTEKKEKSNKKSDNKQQTQAATAEQVAESSVIIYGGLLGRQNLEQIRKTAYERGKIVVTEADGRKNSSSYEKIIIRGENLFKEKIRVDYAFPDARYSLIFKGNKIFGLFNETVFTPRDDASNNFQNQIWHSIESLLRYKENESKIELSGRNKIMGVDFYVLDLTDKENRKTRYFISVKSLRVMMLEYEFGGVKYRRKFYDYNYAQGTLVAYRTILWANDKEIEITDVGTITYGQKVEEALFGVDL